IVTFFSKTPYFKGHNPETFSNKTPKLKPKYAQNPKFHQIPARLDNNSPPTRQENPLKEWNILSSGRIRRLRGADSDLSPPPEPERHPYRRLLVIHAV
ncbi:hypothetical protein, partial [Roseobacter sp. N2S]|uniref:hypothetical protein n=1 Tax=Roseobacter sp. N2S TaxID=2663844 RepID=UPI00286C0D68